jgi:hypothetical protein
MIRKQWENQWRTYIEERDEAADSSEMEQDED